MKKQEFNKQNVAELLTGGFCESSEELVEGLRTVYFNYTEAWLAAEHNGNEPCSSASLLDNLSLLRVLIEEVASMKNEDRTQEKPVKNQGSQLAHIQAEARKLLAEARREREAMEHTDREA